MDAPSASRDPDDWSAGPGASWIVVDNEAGAFDCRRCLIHQPFELPVEFFEWHRLAAVFVSEHRACKAPARPQEQIEIQGQLL